MRPLTLVRSTALGMTIACAAAVPAAAQTGPTGTLDLRVGSRVTFGKPVVASGRLDPGTAGRTVVLEHRAGTGPWSAIGHALVGKTGRYRIRARVPATGALRATLQPRAGGATVASNESSEEVPVTVVANLGVQRTVRNVRIGRRFVIAGRIKPGVAGRTVALQVRRRGRWTTIDRAKTAGAGRYVLRDRVHSTGSLPAVTVTRAGAEVGGGMRSVGRLSAYRLAHASWYGPGLYGNHLGCGGRLGTATLGVAHKTLPCGTRVTLRHRGRTISVRVIDRGPYVGGREFDLTSATARRLGFRGHGPIEVTV